MLISLALNRRASDNLGTRVFSVVHYLFSFFSEYLSEIDMAVTVYVGVPKHNSIIAYRKI